MQSEEALEALPQSDSFPRSLSDRPFAYRAMVQVGRFFRYKPLGGFGVFLVLLCLFCAIFAPWIARYDPNELFNGSNPKYNPELAAKAQTDPSLRLKYDSSVFTPGKPLLHVGPSMAHWLGTDTVSHDLYSRIIYGSRTAVTVGFGSAIIAMLAGTVLGIMSAYWGGAFDFITQRVVDSLQAFPALVLLIVFNQVIASPNIYWIVLSLGIIGIAPLVRVVRSAVLSTREEVYVTAAQTIGASDMRIMAKHIFPNVTAPIIVVFTSSIGVYILAEATLAFLGLGDPTTVSWGQMVNTGRQLGPSSPGMALYVGTALTLTVLGFNLAGDALRDVLDPRLRGRGGRAGF